MRKFFQINKTLLFPLIFLALFLCSHQASAFFDVIPSLASMQLDALDFIDRVVAWLFQLLLLALAGSFFITFSAAFLDWAANYPVNLGNDLVNAGWGFTSGLVNMIFILIFIAIAFSYILKLETWGMKKALPRLIVIAFLLNFSLLFVKMFVDVGWVFQNSLKISLFGSSGMAAPIAEQVAKSSLAAVGQYATWFFLPYYVVALIPFANVAKAVFFATAMLGEGLFGTFSETFLLAVFGLIGGLIFFVYAILFLIRIAVIWLLAIIAPLAFAAFILPQTQKYFSQWLKTLFQWVFLGFVVFFLMGLGLKLFAAVAPSELLKINVGSGGFDFVANYSKFVFLLIYLFISLYAAKKFTPATANAVWAIGGMATGAIGAGTTLLARKGAMKGMTWQSGLASKRAKTKMEPLLAKGDTITAQERAQLGKWTAKFERAEAKTKMLKGLEVQEEKKKILAKTKNMDEETTKLWLSAEATNYGMAKFRDKSKTQAFVELLAEKKALKEGHKTLYEEAVKNAGPDDLTNRVKKAVLPQMLHWSKNDKELGDFIEKMNPADIDKLDRSAKTNDNVIKAVVKSNKSNLISRLAGQNAAALKMVQDELDKTLGEKWKNEPQKLTLEELKVLRSLHNSPSFAELGFRTYGDLSQIQERISGKPPEAPAKGPSKVVLPGSKEFGEEQEKIRKRVS